MKEKRWLDKCILQTEEVCARPRGGAVFGPRRRESLPLWGEKRLIYFSKSHHRGQHWSTIKSRKHQIQQIVNRESSMFLITVTWRCLLLGKKLIEIKLQGRLSDTSRNYFNSCFQYAENFLFNFGLDGKGCLLRAICETHETPLLGHGMVGEILELFLTWVLREQNGLMEANTRFHHSLFNKHCEVLVSCSDWVLGNFIEWHASFKAVVQFYVERRTDKHTHF